MKRYFSLLFCILFATVATSFKSLQETRTVYVYALVRTADVKKTAFSDIFRITIEKGSPYTESSEINTAVTKMESNFKKYMYVQENWDKYVSAAGYYDDSRSKLEEKRLEKMASEKRTGYSVSGSTFSYSYTAGDAYKK